MALLRVVVMLSVLRPELDLPDVDLLLGGQTDFAFWALFVLVLRESRIRHQLRFRVAATSTWSDYFFLRSAQVFLGADIPHLLAVLIDQTQSGTRMCS